MNQSKWRAANRLTPEGLAEVRQRVTGDVRQHIELRRELLALGYLCNPKMWHSGSAIGRVHAVKSLLAAIVIVLALVEFMGFFNPVMRLTTIDDKRSFYVVVSDARADASYTWLTVEGCSASATDEGVLCDHGWYGRSDREWGRDRKQESVPFRDAPKGPLLRFEAVVLDRAGKTRASSSLLTARRF
jgi:hypothetical protein